MSENYYRDANQRIDLFCTQSSGEGYRSSSMEDLHGAEGCASNLYGGPPWSSSMEVARTALPRALRTKQVNLLVGVTVIIFRPPQSSFMELLGQPSPELCDKTSQ